MLDPTQLLLSASYLGIVLLIFAESGLLIGFFLPGDSLMITAGLLAHAGKLHLPGVMAAAFLGAVVGDSAGYLIGRRLGPAVFSRHHSRFFKPEYVERTRDFFARHGGKSLILARFVPVVRTIAPTFAGVGQMPYLHFLSYNVVGGALWAVTVPALADWLGGLIPNLDRHIPLVVALVVAVSLIPVLIELRKLRRS